MRGEEGKVAELSGKGEPLSTGCTLDGEGGISSPRSLHFLVLADLLAHFVDRPLLSNP